MRNDPFIHLPLYQKGVPGRPTWSTASFITLFTCAHLPLLGRLSAGSLQLSQSGTLSVNCWRSLPARFPDVRLDVLACLPDHMDVILLFAQTDSAYPDSPVSTVIDWFQAATTKQFRQWGLGRLRYAAERHLWQQRYHERPIRDEAHLMAVRRYIRRQPARWAPYH